MIIVCDNQIQLRTAEESDAGFIFKLRTDSELNKYLSQVSGTIEDQIAFIKQYKEKEKRKLEYYFIIEYKNNPVGTVRLYNIDYEKSIFTWGSWIVKQGNPGEVALSSAYMTYHLGFHYLNLNKALIDVRKDNSSVFKFHKKYCDYLYEDEINYYLEFKKEDFNRFIDKYKTRISQNLNLIVQNYKL